MQNLNQQATSGPTAFLHCVTGDLPLCVQILDASLLPRIAPVIGNLRAELPLGVYVVQFSVGDMVEETPTALTQPGMTLEVRSEREWSLLTPIPLPGQGKDACVSAQLLSEQSRLSKNEGPGQLLVVLHDANKDAPNWLQGLTFESSDNSLVADFAAQDYDPWRQARFFEWNGPVGTYQLVSNPKETEYATVMPVPLLAGWQTLVFLQPRRYGDSCHAADLPRATVAMVRSGTGFVAGDRSMLRTEAARIAMKLGVNGLQVDIAWVGEKFSNPLLSCFAAHLLLQSARPDYRFLSQELARLLDATGWSPDLQALMWGLRLADKKHEVPGEMWRTLRQQGPVRDAPLIHAACGLLLRAHQEFGEVISPGLVSALEDTGEVASDWAVRKRLPDSFAPTLLQAPVLRSDELASAGDSLLRLASKTLAGVAVNGIAAGANGFLGPADRKTVFQSIAVLRVERTLEAIVKRLQTLDPDLLNTLADRLRPFERAMIEAIFPLINPLNRLAPKDLPARTGKEILEVWSACLQSRAQRRTPAQADADGIQSELLVAIRNITREAKYLKKKNPGRLQSQP